ncbi:MAG: DUF3520 domain-containing protein, partial [Clostridia bacterium]|nr:DUF3520 domain-containing protein [Clostridia bacterium]
YRLIGYENRILNTEDFDDDTKDAGDVGAGHQVTVCYELVLKNEAIPAEGEADTGWMKLAVRYKNPGEAISLLNEYTIGSEQLAEEADEDMQFLTCVIETAMLLHKSAHLKNVNIANILEALSSLDLSKHPDRAEFLELIRTIASK